MTHDQNPVNTISLHNIMWCGHKIFVSCKIELIAIPYNVTNSTISLILQDYENIEPD